MPAPIASLLNAARRVAAGAVLAACAAALSPAWGVTVDTPPPSPVPEPKVERIHIEDDAVTIDELRVRGVTQRITVTPKNGVPYDIVPPDATRDPNTRTGTGSVSVGRRVWNVLRF